MDIPMLRTWAIFYLLSFVVLLFALFLSTQGVLLWVSLFLVILLIGVNLFTVSMEIKRRSMKKERLKTISRNEDPEYLLDQKKLW
jgi:Flp pilus assembly protein TadB